MVRGVTSDLQTRRVHLIHKRLSNVQRNVPLSSRKYPGPFSLFHHQLKFPVAVIPHLLEDSRRMMENWGLSGQFDPFENVYEVSTTA